MANDYDYRFFISEIDLINSKHIAYYLISEDTYQGITSLNAFFWGRGQRQRNKSKSRLYHIQRVADIDLIASLYSGKYPEYCSEIIATKIIKSGQAIKCENIFDFYKKIGYNYKKQRYEK